MRAPIPGPYSFKIEHDAIPSERLVIYGDDGLVRIAELCVFDFGACGPRFPEGRKAPKRTDAKAMGEFIAALLNGAEGHDTAGDHEQSTQERSVHARPQYQDNRTRMA